jgi:hypothetical protein
MPACTLRIPTHANVLPRYCTRSSITAHFQGVAMNKKIISILTLSTLCCSTAAWAAGPMKPGLWEMTIKSDAMKAMPKMAPEQMEMMRKRGINLPQMQDGGMVMKMCITKEMGERTHPMAQNQIPQHQSECKPQSPQTSGNSYTMAIVCNGPNMKGEGKVHGIYTSNESYSSTYDFTGVARGHPINQHSETSSKWLGADCGDVKPVGHMMPKDKK